MIIHHQQLSTVELAIKLILIKQHNPSQCSYTWSRNRRNIIITRTITNN